VEFIVNGKHYSLTKQEVEAKVRRVPPGHIFEHAIEIDDVLYPVKQAFAVATDLPPVEFTTQRARDVLRRLGFSDPRTTSSSSPQPAATAEQAALPVWIFEIRTLADGSHVFELDEKQDVQALEAEISRSIGSDGSYQVRIRNDGAVGGVSALTIAWRHVATATLYQREGRSAA
jgi:hypothetical protein